MRKQYQQVDFIEQLAQIHIIDFYHILELKHPVPKRCSNLYKQGQAQIEIAKMSERKTSYLIAPDGK